ncbi:hypothetical protein ACJX0J_028853, partial [Zea mays]
MQAINWITKLAFDGTWKIRSFFHATLLIVWSYNLTKQFTSNEVYYSQTLYKRTNLAYFVFVVDNMELAGDKLIHLAHLYEIVKDATMFFLLTG